MFKKAAAAGSERARPSTIPLRKAACSSGSSASNHALDAFGSAAAHPVSKLRDLLGLDEGAARKVRERLTAEFELLRARGLDRPSRPVEGQEEWHARRDRMLLEAAARIEALIPAPQRKPHAVEKIMNLGSCFRFGAPKVVEGERRKLDFFYQEPGGKRIPL